MKPTSHSEVMVQRYQGVTEPPQQQIDQVAVEEPLEIRVGGQSVAITMRTPGNDRELAAGFLLSEGILRKPDEIIEIAHCLVGESAATGNILNVFLNPDLEFDLKKLTRHTFASSSCGICGKSTIESLRQVFPPCSTPTSFDLKILPTLPPQMREAQSGFAQTGGLHAAALFNFDGQLRALFEDVGRHNAVDKILGHALLAGWLPLQDHILLVSGRSSFEMVQKAWAGGISALASISAPSSLAVDLAHEANLLLIGFLRGNNFNSYSPKPR